MISGGSRIFCSKTLMFCQLLVLDGHLTPDDFFWSAQGRIVVTNSLLSTMVAPFVIPYSMSKAASKALVEGLQRELGCFGIYCSSIEPSYYVWADKFNKESYSRTSMPLMSPNRVPSSEFLGHCYQPVDVFLQNKDDQQSHSWGL